MRPLHRKLVRHLEEPGRVHELTFLCDRRMLLLTAIKRRFAGRIKRDLMQRFSQLVETLTVRQRPGAETFRFWQEGPGYDRNFFEPRTIGLAVDDIHGIPVRRGLCERAFAQKWSSAR